MEVPQIQRDCEKNQILESIQDAFFTLDQEWRFSYINKRAISIVGREPEELIGKVIWEESPDIIGTDLEETCRKAMDIRVVQRIEIKCVLTGSWYNIIVFPSEVGITVYCQDITGQKQTEEAFKENERKYRMLLDSIDYGRKRIEMEPEKQMQELKQSEANYLDVLDSLLDGNWVMDCVNGTIQCSEQWARRIGLDQIPEKDHLTYIRSLIHPDDKIKADVIYSCSKSRKFDLEYRIKTIDKGYIWTQNRGKIICDEIGNPLKVYAVTFDITERKESEEKYRRIVTTIKDITERKENENKLVFQANLLASVHDAICATDENHIITYWNDMAEQMFGCTSEEVIGQPAEKLFKTIVPGFKRNDAIQVMFKDGYYSSEAVYHHRDGREIFTDVHSRILKDQEGKFKGTVSSFRDITERKKADKTLKEREKLYRTLFDNSQDGFAITEILYDENGKPFDLVDLKINKAYEVQTGLKTADILGKKVSEYAPNLEQDWLEIEDEVVKTGKTKHFEKYHLNTNRWYDVYMFPYSKNTFGQLFRDITERKIAEQEVIRLKDESARKATDKYLKLFNSIDEGFSIIEMIYDNNDKAVDYRILETNPAMERLLGLKAEDVVGKRFREIISIIDEQMIENIGKVALTGKPLRFENRQNGFGHCFDIHASRFGDEGSMVALVYNDITERMKAEQMLRESKERALDLVEKLRQQDQNKNVFLNMLSHELRNPLASIMMSLSLLNRVPAYGEQALKAQKIATRQGEQLTRLVDDLLDVARITQNKITLKKEHVELNRLVEQTVVDYQGQFKEKEVALESKLTSTSLFLEADPARLTQIIGNLLHNASKFTSKGDQVLVTVGHEESTQEAIITVEDNGIGIKLEILPNLFEPFMQADSTLDRSSGGLGLGLAIVKGMAELHGGSVFVHSEGLGKGTQITIRLPLRVVEAGKNEPGSETGGLSECSFRILIIDDIPDIIEILSSLLRYLGHEVATALNGPEGISKAKEFRPEVLICDIGLPSMNGYEVAKCFRNDKELKDTFLIALSGYAQQEDLERAEEAGFENYLVKPVNLDTLEQVLAEVSIHK
jgi:PAS domain S-box-containing protein